MCTHFCLSLAVHVHVNIKGKYNESLWYIYKGSSELLHYKVDFK